MKCQYDKLKNDGTWYCTKFFTICPTGSKVGDKGKCYIPPKISDGLVWARSTRKIKYIFTMPNGSIVLEIQARTEALSKYIDSDTVRMDTYVLESIEDLGNC